jgi:hypothetical protein
VEVRTRPDVDRVNRWKRGICIINCLVLNSLAYSLATRRIDGAGTVNARRVPDVDRVIGWYCESCGVNSDRAFCSSTSATPAGAGIGAFRIRAASWCNCVRCNSVARSAGPRSLGEEGSASWRRPRTTRPGGLRSAGRPHSTFLRRRRNAPESAAGQGCAGLWEWHDAASTAFECRTAGTPMVTGPPFISLAIPPDSACAQML